VPSPLQTGHAPRELKLNRDGSVPVARANSRRTASKKPMYVAGFDREDLPTGD